MKLEDKRKVIEVLLVAATPWNPEVFGAAVALCIDEWLGGPIGQAAASLYMSTMDQFFDDDASYAQAATEAAYRLIESSPTLIREWFGRQP